MELENQHSEHSEHSVLVHSTKTNQEVSSSDSKTSRKHRGGSEGIRVPGGFPHLFFVWGKGSQK